MSAGAVPPGAIEHTLPWGPVVRGLRWGDGAGRVLLLHEPGTDVDAWGLLPACLASRLTLTLLAIDLPGHGLSDDPWQPERLPDIVHSLLAGATERPFVIAAGSIAGMLLEFAAELAPGGLVLFSPEANSGTRPNRSPAVPKLIFAGSVAGDDLAVARQLAAMTGGWTLVTGIPGSTRGTALLNTPWQTRICEQIAAFIRDGQRGPVTPRTLA